MYSSELICKGCGIPPAEPSPPRKFTPTWCMLCGRPVTDPDEAVAWSPGSSFTDWQYLQPGPCRVACRYCAALLTKSRLTALSKTVVSLSEGAFLLSKDAHLTWFLLDPPKAPFIAMFAPQSQKRPLHLFWRGRPTLDPDLVFVQFGGSSLMIRRKVLDEALEKAARAAEIAREEGIQLSAAHPFESLSRKLDSPTHGSVRPKITTLALQNKELQGLLQFLSGLTTGELWAMSVLSKSNPETPLREPIQID